jgi:hypothetical protein
MSVPASRNAASIIGRRPVGKSAARAFDVKQDTAGKNRRELVRTAMLRPDRAADAVAGKAVVEFIVVPDVAKGIDVGAGMKRQDQSILGELESVRALGASRVIAPVTSHEVTDPGAMPGNRRPRRQRLT